RTNAKCQGYQCHYGGKGSHQLGPQPGSYGVLNFLAMEQDFVGLLILTVGKNGIFPNDPHYHNDPGVAAHVQGGPGKPKPKKASGDTQNSDKNNGQCNFDPSEQKQDYNKHQKDRGDQYEYQFLKGLLLLQIGPGIL